MSEGAKAYVGARVHDGQKIHDDLALVIAPGDICSLVRSSELATDIQRQELNGGVILPGFVDLQVNGGGGLMFNDDQSVETLRTIAGAHATTGTVALLPTLITDSYDKTFAAIDAVEQAIAQNVAGIVGIHLEGPHLSVARKGAHDPTLIRTMNDADLALLLSAADRLPNIMVTVAPENTTPTQINQMAKAGIIVSLGHTDADFETCMDAFDAGAKCATHLFNAMSQMTNREPGLVGAVLARQDVYAGLIADGIHVHPTSIQLALRAKLSPEKVFLVTDAMATAGSDIDQFSINDRQVFRKDSRLTLENGTLAGADLEMSRAIDVMVNSVGDDPVKSIARTTSIPASLLRNAGSLGTLNDPNELIYFEDGFSRARKLI